MPLVAFGGFGRLLDGCMAGFVPVCGDAWLASCPLGHNAIYFNTKNKSLCETQFIYICKPKSLFTFRGLLNFGKVVELKIIKAYDFGIISFKGYIILLIFF